MLARGCEEKNAMSRRWLNVGVILAVLFSLGLWAGNRQKQEAQNNSRTADWAAIEAVLNAQQASWNQGDVDAFLEGYWRSPLLTFSGSSGVSRGWDRVLARYKKRYPDRAAMGRLQFSDLEFRFLGPDAALVLGQWHLQREQGDLGGVFSLIWQRFPDGWKIIHDHTSTVENAPAK